MRKKMRYLPGFLDLICFKIFNIGDLGVDKKHKKHVPGGPPWPEFGMHLPTILSKVFLSPKDPDFN